MGQLLFQVSSGHLCPSSCWPLGGEGPQTQVVLHENQQTRKTEAFCERDGSSQGTNINLYPVSCVFAFKNYDHRWNSFSVGLSLTSAH